MNHLKECRPRVQRITAFTAVSVTLDDRLILSVVTGLSRDHCETTLCRIAGESSFPSYGHINLTLLSHMDIPETLKTSILIFACTCSIRLLGMLIMAKLVP